MDVVRRLHYYMPIAKVLAGILKLPVIFERVLIQNGLRWAKIV